MPTEQYDQATRIRAIMELGINLPGDLEAVSRLPVEQAKVLLDELKTRVKKIYANIIGKYHPDTNGGSAEKTHWFKVLTYEKGEFLGLEVRPAPPPPPMIPVGVRVGGGVPFAVSPGISFGVMVNGVPINTTSATNPIAPPGFVTISFVRFR